MKAGLYKICAGVIAIAFVVAAPIMAGASSTPISNLIVRPQGDFVELTVIGGGRVMCENFSEAAENGRPFRIVLDFCDADHALGQQTFDALPATQIARIRTSQFATTPQRIVRVVLDMRGEVTYTTRNEGSSLVVRFVDPNRTFAVWEANPGAGNATPSNTAPTLAVNTPSVAKTVTGKESAPESQSTPVTRPKPENTVKPAPVVAQTPPPSVPETTSKKTAQSAAQKDNATKPVSDASPVVALDRPKTQTQVVVGAVPDPVTPETPAHSEATDEKPVLAETPATPVTPVTNNNTGDANSVTGTKSFVVPPVPLVFAPEYFDGSKPMVTESPAPSRDFVVSKESLTPEGPKQPTPAELANAETEAAEAMWASTTGPKPGAKAVSRNTATEDGKSVDDTEIQPTGTLLDRLKSKFFGNQIAPRPYTTVDGETLPGSEPFGPPTPTNDLDREALLERIRQTEQRVAAGGSGDDLTDEGGAGGVPTRVILTYDDMGRRDPFEPLVTGLRSGFVTDQLPDIETLRLVGVLHDDVEALALLENVEGYSYIMRAGDKVQNGSLVAVQGNRALFRVDDYGWSHVVALQLTPRGTDPSKSLGLAPRNYPEHDEDSEGEKSKSTDNQGSDGE